MTRSGSLPVALQLRSPFVVFALAILFHSIAIVTSASSSNETNKEKKMPSAVVILAEGAEEMEAVITIDILRRGEIDVTVAGLAGAGEVKCSRDVVIKPDKSLADALAKEYDAVIIPGGLKGSQAIGASPVVKTLLEAQEKKGKYIAAICAGPTALMSHGIFSGKKLTSYPAFKDKLSEGGYKYSEDRVVVDGKLITSRGPGTSFEFGLAIVTALAGKEKSDSLIAPMLVKM